MVMYYSYVVFERTNFLQAFALIRILRVIWETPRIRSVYLV
jgi:hypothetical protein